MSVKNKLPKLDTVLVSGILLSLALALFLMLTGQDESTSLLVGLITTVITLLIEIIARLKESESRVLKSIRLGELLEQDNDLYAIMCEIAENHKKINNGQFDLFIQHSNDALEECRDILAGLERGYMVIPPGGKYAFGRKSLTQASRCVKAVAYEDIESWRTEHLKDVLRVNAESIARGITIQRVFILEPGGLEKSRDVLDAHKTAGVQVFCASPDDLPSTELLESFQVIDDKVLVVFYYTRDGRRFTGERISIDPVEVDKAISKFDTISRRAKPY